MNAILNLASRLLPGLGRHDDVYAFNGGVHPPEHKAESNTRPIAKLGTPKTLVLPLRQHVGHLPKVLVKVGDRVLKGQLLAEAEGTVSAAIHAPTSGTVTAIDEQVIPHPSGLPDCCITLSCDGLDEWAPLQPINWRLSDKKTLVDSLRLSGIVGLGGATFPSHIKLRSNSQSPIHTLIINAAECEPYITCDDMLMRERADEIVAGIEIVKHLLGAETCLIGIEDNKAAAGEAMKAACQEGQALVKVVPTLYPSGDARRLIHLLLDLEIPSDKRSTDLGVQVFNVATVLAIHRYFAFGEPSISRIVTVTGNVASPQNFEVLFGTPLTDLIAAAGGAQDNTSHFIMGGPMMGFDLPNSQVPITKAANCIIAAKPDLFPAPPPAMPCIRCTRCADACPVNLQPQELYWFAKSDNFEKARDYKLFDCIECGCCSYVCPSTIPLVQYYRYAKSEIIAADKAKEAADLARERNDFRLARIEREKLERAQKHAERAAANKNEVSAKADAAEAIPSATPSDSAVSDKQAAIAAAIARAKAQKLASGPATDQPPASKTAPSKADVQATPADKQALIAAAIERAKAAKLAAAQAGLAPKNTENVSPSVQAEIKQTDAIREKARRLAESDTSEPDKG
jgi:electron transport complex protein RnfC